MPIYEYVCDNCSHHLEALQKMSDDPLVFCPECGEAALRKQVSAAAFRLKGTGWYETDFKNSDKKKPAESKDKKPGGDSTSDSASSSGTKDKSSGTSTSSSTETSSSSSSGGKPGSSASGSA
tara:strand:+ start:78 stop:443 length:366 start_codon:yes stop_codon:yes gene_type:complete